MTHLLRLALAAALCTGAAGAACAAPAALPSAAPAAALVSAPVTATDRAMRARMTRGMVLSDVQRLWREQSGRAARPSDS